MPVGSCTTTRTSDLYSPNPAIAPTTPSHPTVAVSMAFPSFRTKQRKHPVVRKVYVINFIASFDQHQPLRQRLGYEVGGKQIELVARQRRQQFIVQRTAQLFSMHFDILPGRSGRFPQGG